MSDIMLLGVLNMPLPDDPAKLDAMTWLQFRGRAREAAQRIQADAEALDSAQAVLNNFEVTGPDDDGLVWLVLHGKGTTGQAMFNLGYADKLAAQVALKLEEDRRAALAAQTDGRSEGLTFEPRRPARRKGRPMTTESTSADDATRRDGSRLSEGLGAGAGVHGHGECGCPLCGWNGPWLPCICYTPASTGETIAYTSGTGKQWLGGTVDGA